jgi:D-aminoacyl-tRNA deacylase
MRPSFTPAVDQAEGERLFAYLSQRAQVLHPTVAYGRFGSHMQITLTNDGPVTFWLQASPRAVEDASDRQGSLF